MERFGMDNDYEDAQRIGGEFYGKRCADEKAFNREMKFFTVYLPTLFPAALDHRSAGKI